ncbi:MAG: hypothetical protein C0498_00845 [Anaerolinea sp.]|nr:hypothetical protein [Anaerolinea sp.]
MVGAAPGVLPWTTNARNRGSLDADARPTEFADRARTPAAGRIRPLCCPDENDPGGPLDRPAGFGRSVVRTRTILEARWTGRPDSAALLSGRERSWRPAGPTGRIRPRLHRLTVVKACQGAAPVPLEMP